MPKPSLEQRLSTLEAEMTRLKTRLKSGDANGNWVAAVSGRFKGDKAFREILRLGKELRDAETDESDATNAH